MRLVPVFIRAVVSLTVSLALTPPAAAEGFFQKYFGFGSASPAPTRLPPQRFAPKPNAQAEPQVELIGPPDSGGPYRTMCVRTCDGFYYPLRFTAWRRHFADDARSCRAACGDQGRLFYYSAQSGGIATMSDLAGRHYRDLSNAFAYRKQVLDGCRCRPQPWSPEALAEHRQYAAKPPNSSTPADLAALPALTAATPARYAPLPPATWVRH